VKERLKVDSVRSRRTTCRVEGGGAAGSSSKRKRVSHMVCGVSKKHT
jgi:hypothetical protein